MEKVFDRGARIIGLGVIAAFVGVTASWGLTPGRENFIDYYTTASSLITTLNAAAGDLERLDLKSGTFSNDDVEELKARLTKVREGFAAVITYNDHTNELNEGYILYIDKVLLALIVAQEYAQSGGEERLGRVQKLLTESSALRANLNATIRRDKKKFGVE